MSAKIINYVDWPAENGIIAQCCCDTVAELPAVNAFPTFGLLATTSTCRVIDTDELYQLNSLGVWKKKTQATSVALDLTGYYTADQIDALFQSMMTDTFDHRYLRIGTGFRLDDGTDLDTVTERGKYNNVNADNGCLHMPAEVAGRPFTLNVENTPRADRVRQTMWMSQVTVIDRFFWRTQYTSAGAAVWSSWYKVTGSAVL